MNVVKDGKFYTLYRALVNFSLNGTFPANLSSVELSRPRVLQCKFQEHLRNVNVLFSVFKREVRQARWPWKIKRLPSKVAVKSAYLEY